MLSEVYDDGTFLATRYSPSVCNLINSISNASIPSSRPLIHVTGYGEPFAHEADAPGWVMMKYAWMVVVSEEKNRPSVRMSGVSIVAVDGEWKETNENEEAVL